MLVVADCVGDLGLRFRINAKPLNHASEQARPDDVDDVPLLPTIGVRQCPARASFEFSKPFGVGGYARPDLLRELEPFIFWQRHRIAQQLAGVGWSLVVGSMRSPAARTWR